MRYEIILHNQHANQQLDFVELDDAIEAAPTPITPNIPAGGIGATLQVRVISEFHGRSGGSDRRRRRPPRRNDLLFPKPMPMGCVSTKSGFFRLSPEVLSPFSAAPRPGPSPNPHTGNYQAYRNVFLPTGPKLAVSRFGMAAWCGGGGNPLDGASFASLERILIDLNGFRSIGKRERRRRGGWDYRGRGGVRFRRRRPHG